VIDVSHCAACAQACAIGAVVEFPQFIRMCQVFEIVPKLLSRENAAKVFRASSVVGTSEDPAFNDRPSPLSFAEFAEALGRAALIICSVPPYRCAP